MKRSPLSKQRAGVRRVAERFCCALFAAPLALGIGWDTGAHAQAIENLTLRWDAPEECPDQAAVLARVRAHAPSGHGSARDRFAQARVTKQDARYRLELVLRTPESRAHKTIESEACTALADAAALLIALALDPKAAATLNSRTGSTERGKSAGGDAHADAQEAIASAPKRSLVPGDVRQRPPTAAAHEALAPTERSVDASDPDAGAHAPSGIGNGREIGLDAGAALRLGFGMLPQTPALGFSPQLGLRLGRLLGRIGVTFWLEARTVAERYPSATLDAHGVLGDATVCIELVRVPIALAPCVIAELGQLVLESHRIRSPARSTAGWGAGGGGVYSGYVIAGGFRATLDAHLLGPFSRPRWLVRTAQGNAELFVTDPVTVRIAFGVAFVYP
jgi:hypothetical protein